MRNIELKAVLGGLTEPHGNFWELTGGMKIELGGWTLPLTPPHNSIPGINLLGRLCYIRYVNRTKNCERENVTDDGIEMKFRRMTDDMN